MIGRFKHLAELLHRFSLFYKNNRYTITPACISDACASFTVYCDMVTDGGGWTIVGAVTGADNEQPFTSNVTVDGDPFKVRGLCQE